MSARDPHSARRAGGVTDTLAWKTGALVVIATMAILLWRIAVPLAADAVTALRSPASATARVGECDIHRSCLVTYTDASGRTVAASLVRPGMFALAPGEELRVSIAADGTLGLGAGRAGLDALVLLGLAVAFTGYALGWFKRVLDHGGPPRAGR